MNTLIRNLAFHWIVLAVPAVGSVHTQDNAPETEVQVHVFKKGGAGKFNQANITREENKVIQAVFGRSPGDVLETIITSPGGAVYISGQWSSPDSETPIAPTRLGGAGGTAFVARLSPDLRRMEKLALLPPNFRTARCLATGSDGSVAVAGEDQTDGLAVARLNADLDTLLWTRNVLGDRAVSIAVAPDLSVIVCPNEKPFVSRIAADGSKLVPFGDADTFRTDGGNPEVRKAWWEGQGYPEAGYTRGATYHRGGSGGVVALPDGTFVLFTTHFLHHPGGGPDFDPMLLKFDGNGKILWCTHLLEGLPAESDHKQARLGFDPHTGDLLAACIQHGHFSKNLISTPTAYLTTEKWFTGNIMIGWIARIDPGTGKPKAATFFFPEMPGPVVAGKKRANSLFPCAPTADAEGNVYVTGKTAWKFRTTLHAFQSEPIGGSGFVAVFNRDLSQIRYASVIAARGYNYDPKNIISTPGGPAVVAQFEISDGDPGGFIGANADATNYLSPQPTGKSGSILGYYPAVWKIP